MRKRTKTVDRVVVFQGRGLQWYWISYAGDEPVGESAEGVRNKMYALREARRLFPAALVEQASGQFVPPAVTVVEEPPKRTRKPREQKTVFEQWQEADAAGDLVVEEAEAEIAGDWEQAVVRPGVPRVFPSKDET